MKNKPLHTIIEELNVSIYTVVEYLKSIGLKMEPNPNENIEPELEKLLRLKFRKARKGADDDDNKSKKLERTDDAKIHEEFTSKTLSVKNDREEIISNENLNSLITIGQNIEKHRGLETEHLLRPDKRLAIAHANVYYFGERRKFWLTGKAYEGDYSVQRNIQGGLAGTLEGDPTTIMNNGKVIYKNSPLGGILIGNSIGKHEVSTPKGNQTLEVFNFTSYIPNPHNADAKDIMMNFGGEKPRLFPSISYLIDALENNRLEEQILQDQEELEKINKEELEKKSDAEKSRRKEELENDMSNLQKQLKEKQEESAMLRSSSRSFIRKHAELRHQPILDSWQEEIKRSHLFEGAIAINGGPGTGKTTALIQRIKFLTDKTAMLGQSKEQEADEFNEGYFPKMSITQQKILFEENNWIFFSPSELLKLFLKNSMIKEGLKAEDSKIWVWEKYKNVLIKKYNFINTETRNPFLILNNGKEEILLPSDAEQLNSIINDFDQYFIYVITKSFLQIEKLDTVEFSWHNKIVSLVNYITDKKEINTISELIRTFIYLEDNFSDSFEELNKEYLSKIQKLSLEYLVRLKKDESWETTETFLAGWLNSYKSNQKDDDELEIEEDLEVEEITLDVDHFTLQQFRSITRKIAISKHDGKQKLTKNQDELLNKITNVLQIEEHEEFDRVAELAFFNKYFVKYTKGIIANIYRKLPQIYKNYRKLELKNKESVWNIPLLDKIVNDPKAKNKRIHPNEQAFLIYFTNKLVLASRKISKRKTESYNHPYVEAFYEVICPVIAVDEATDFHIIDLITMNSLSHPEISSVTYSGDLMQRLTYDGIKKWDELKPFISNFEIKELKISYRQSPTLLAVANKIYSKATGVAAEYISFSERDQLEPKPLIFEETNEDEKIEWIAERILEIYKSYGRMIPSIAIFLPSSSDIIAFSKKLGQLDSLCDVGINVVACENGEILGDKDSVRVFSIDYVKGLEFEAAFFHNIDVLYSEFNNKSNEELLLKNIYVGLSRAAFYLGLTCTSKENIQFISDLFESKELSWSIK